MLSSNRNGLCLIKNKVLILSPYQTVMPAKADMFFGREEEIAQVAESIDTTSTAILGARRIGKTSMLSAIGRALEERENLLFYLDGYYVEDYAGFFAQMRTEWESDPRFSKLDFSLYGDINGFTRFVADVRTLYPEKHIVFQFDEVDRLLRHDTSDGRDEPLFRMFRSLAQKQRCQFVFSGERTFLDKLADPHSGFFNFTKPIKLGLLDEKIARELIRRPMSLIGIKLESPEKIIQRIYQQTSGHPKLIQDMCEMLLMQARQSGSLVITLQMLENVVRTFEFRENCRSTFWSQAEPQEKAMSVVICQRERANIDELLQELRKVGFDLTIAQIERGLRYLTLSQLLINVEKHYEIKPQCFAEYLSDFPVEEWFNSFLSEWQEKQEK